MSNQQNDILKDRAWDMACEKFDVTAPNEVIAEEAEKIYQELLEGTPIKGLTRTQLLQGENRFLNSFSGDENYTFNR